VNALDLRMGSTDHAACEHDVLPVRVLLVVGGKKIAHCPGCGKSSLVAESSAEALASLRGLQRPTFVGQPTALGGRATDSKR
jgi:hypothetical protein